MVVVVVVRPTKEILAEGILFQIDPSMRSCLDDQRNTSMDHCRTQDHLDELERAFETNAQSSKVVLVVVVVVVVPLGQIERLCETTFCCRSLVTEANQRKGRKASTRYSYRYRRSVADHPRITGTRTRRTTELFGW